MRRLILPILFSCLLLSQPGWAQAPDTLATQLPTVELSTNRLSAYALGQRVQVWDSAALRPFTGATLADVLAATGGGYVRRYGPTGISSPALRGGSSQQTALVWQGFNLQQSTHGQVDLGLWPVALLDQVSLTYGGSSSLFGSSAMSGVISLDSRPFTSAVQAGVQAASYGRYQPWLGLAHAGQRSGVRVRAFSTGGDNAYPYRNIYLPDQPVAHMLHASQQQAGSMAESYFLPNKNNRLTLNAWGQNSLTEIPRATSSQTDRSGRLALAWERTGVHTRLNLRSGYFQDYIRYLDPQANLDEITRTRTWMNEGEWKWQVRPGHFVQVGLLAAHYQAVVDGYGTHTPSEWRQSAFVAWKGNWKQGRLQTALTLREQWVAFQHQATSPAANWKLALPLGFSWIGSGSRNYRLPTFNDRFWSPGGNPDLLPESSTSVETGLQNAWLVGQSQVRAEVQVYSNWVKNWIIWLPGPRYWSPSNLQQVWSRGVEGMVSWKKDLSHQVHAEARLSYQYTRAVQQVSRFAGDDALGKQLIYTPLHAFQGQFSLNRKNLFLAAYPRFTSKRYNTTDNSSALPGFFIADLAAGFSPTIAHQPFDFTLRVDNLFNQTYTYMAGQPMPLRTASLALAWTFLP